AKPSGDATRVTSLPSHSPPASRKVGTPLSAEMPAPVSTRTQLESSSAIDMLHECHANTKQSSVTRLRNRASFAERILVQRIQRTHHLVYRRVRRRLGVWRVRRYRRWCLYGGRRHRPVGGDLQYWFAQDLDGWWRWR